MITLKTLKWSNLFSYNKENEVNFHIAPITQLIGKNGHGKSSIALILEEVLFNKNSKGIKKADILNRHIKDKTYSIELTFDKDNDSYDIKTTRGSAQTVQVFKNGINISSHTATATFKIIESILGLDHKAFSQLVYQSSSSSLEFLTATDTNRKKFLIDLLNLTRYVEAFDIFKVATKEVADEILTIETAAKTSQAWLDKHSKEDLNIQELLDIPIINPEIEQQLISDKAKQSTILETNKRITKNNLYRDQLNSINLSNLPIQQGTVEDTSSYIKGLGEHQKTITDANNLITKIGKLNGTCPTCLQAVNRSKLDDLIKEQESLKIAAEEAIIILNNKIFEINKTKNAVDKARKLQTDWETYHSLVDPNLSTTLINAEELSKRIKVAEETIGKATAEILKITKLNNNISAHNSRVEVITNQIASIEEDLVLYYKKLEVVTSKLSNLQILQKTFSNSGLLAYKIECLVKDLEELVNEYLADLSDGRFQLAFKVTASDKLNVIITDNGRDIEMLALSGGERARVNTATLLAIRKLMQSLSNSRINLLILDETIDTLDADGKEKLIEVLLKEEHLNTVLVSHGYTHPLLEKITVIKENNISRLEQ